MWALIIVWYWGFIPQSATSAPMVSESACYAAAAAVKKAWSIADTLCVKTSN